MKRNCGVCNRNAAKYKCPTCFLPFCSLPCNRTHKQSACSAPPPAEPPLPPCPSQTSPAPDHALLTREQLARLDDDPEVLRKTADKRVLAAIARVDSASDRAVALEKEMQDPAFIELCDDIHAALGMSEDTVADGDGRK